MSIRIMAAVFESKTLGPTERLVMLALADHADDDGKCYPSVLRLCERTGLSERAVQTNVKKLIEAGYLSVHFGGGKGHANLYFISANPAGNAPYEAAKPRTKCTPQEMHPAAGAPQTPQQVRSNPAADAPEPSGTIIEPSIEEIGEPISRRPTENLAPCIDHFNATAARVGWPQVQRLTDARRAALSHRITDCGGQEAWRDAIDRAAASPLLTGQTGRGWRADFDWLCKAANFTKLMEGNYDPRPDHIIPAHQRGPGGAHDSMVAAFAGVARRQ